MSAPIHINKLVKSNPRLGDYFGGSVLFSGDGSTLVCTAASFDVTDHNIATVSIYNLVNGEYIYFQDLPIPSDVVTSDHIATYCQINYDGNLIIINAEHYDVSATNHGALFVYELNTSWDFKNTIRIEASILPVSGLQTNEFGFQFSLSNDGRTMVASAPFDNGSGTLVGAAYILESENNWSTFSYIEIKTALSNNNEKLGYNCSISPDGNIVFLGGFNFDESGEVFIYVKDQVTGWPITETVSIKFSDDKAGDLFGVYKPGSLDTEYAGVAIASSYDEST